MRGGFRGRGRGRMPPFSGHPSRPPPFDIYTCGNVFERINDRDDTKLTQDVVARGTTLTPSDEERTKVSALVTKVKAVLDKFLASPDLIPSLKIEEYLEVGSFKKDTSLAGAKTADLAVVLSTLPTFESVAALGKQIVDDLKAQKEGVTCLPREFGAIIAGIDAQVRLLITTLPSNASSLEPDLHLSELELKKSHYSMRHVRWFEGVTGNIQPIKVLIRVLKDVRKRHEGFKALSPFVIDFLAFYCMTNTSNHQPLSLGPAFRRFFELLAAGIFLPGTAMLLDPTDAALRIGFDLTFEEQDLICCTAQTLLRVINYGGHPAILGTDPKYADKDLSRTTSVWNGVTITPLPPAYTEDCMKPKFAEEDESLAKKMASQTVA